LSLIFVAKLFGGEVSDSRNFETLLDIGSDINPRAAFGDKGYDSKPNRQAARQRRIRAGPGNLHRRISGVSA
jgi:hypothetical protein